MDHIQSQMTTLGLHPWHTVNVDFAGPFPTSEYLLVVIDAYSHFLEFEIVPAHAAARGKIGKLDRIFSTHGIPKAHKKNDGPPFSSTEFKVYIQERGICNQKSTPLWPQANAEAENFMKPLTKTIRSACGRKTLEEVPIPFPLELSCNATQHYRHSSRQTSV